MNHCKHYSYEVNPKCSLGIDPIQHFGPTAGWMRRAPCFGPRGSMVCEFAEYLTPKEIAASHEEMNKLMDVIFALVNNLPKDVNGGTIPCPVCDSDLDWSRSPSNGHIHALCRTNGCVSFMQ